MPRLRQQLTVKKIDTIKNKPGRYSAGRNLELVIRANGDDEVNRRSWMFRYFDPARGYQREKGLGPFPDISLEQARTFAEKLRMKMLEAKHLGGTFDPIGMAHAARDARKAEDAKRMTFGECAERFIAAKADQWRGGAEGKSAKQWRNTLEKDTKLLWTLPVASIDTGHLMSCLEPIWKTKTETAARVRQRVERILDWAEVRKYRKGENPARWRGHLQHLLAEPTKLKQVKHHEAVPHAEIGDFMGQLRARGGMGAKALEFQILTAVRPGEACGARWDEIDLKARMWVIPAHRMKASHEHRVPLSDDAVKLLEGLDRVDAFAFPGCKKDTPVTTASGMKVMKSLRPGKTAHGFRSTFRDWAADSTRHPREVIEHALAHRLKDKAEAAYFRSDMLAKRSRLMLDWAKACRTKAPTARGDKVVQIGKRA
jgi:integrase